MKKLEINRLRRSIVFYIAIAMFILSVIVVTSISINAKIIQDKKEKNYARQINSSINHVVKHFLQDYTYRVRRIVETTALPELLEKRDREAVYKMLKPKFDIMQEESPYVAVMQIHLADGSSFLRVHKPEVYGDDIASKRAMLKEIHKNHKIVTGYETGKYSTVYRVISPIFNRSGNYIGAFEIGVNPNFILDAINDINNFCGLMFIKDSELQLYSKPNNLVVEGYRLQSRLNEELKNICKIFNISTLKHNTEIEVGDKKYLTHLIILKNFKGEDSVKLIFYQDITDTESSLNILTFNFYFLIFIVLLILTFFIYRRIGSYQDRVEIVYKDAQEELSFNRDYVQSVFDATPQIMITTDGKELDRVNPAMLKFFEYENVESFKDEHDCICDFFIESEDCIGSEVDGSHWLDYILKNQEELHKVCIKKGDKKYHFTVSAHSLKIDDKHRSVVTFNDVTEVEELGERLEIAVNGTNDGLWDWNLITNEVYFSPRWKEMLGFSDSELANEFDSWELRVHPDDLKQAVDNISAAHVKPNIPYEGVHRLRHKDGSWVWILDRGQTIFDESGRAVRMVGFHTDITKQKELELQLLENEKLYYDFFENTKSANIMYSTDDDGKTFKIKALNKLVEELEGVIREDIIGKRVDEIFEGVEEFGLLDIFKEVYSSGNAYRMPITLYEDKKIKGYRENYIFKLSNGDIVASYENKTQEKTLDLLLKNTINSLENLVFVKDSEFKYLECNGAFEKFIGHSREEIIGHDDYEFFPKELADVFRAKDTEMFDSSSKTTSLEWTTFADGREVYLYTMVSPLYSEDGEVIGLVGNAIDLTQQKKLEDDLRASQEQFEQFMEFIPANIIIKDENRKIVYANSSAEKFFNQEIVGKSAEELFPEDIIRNIHSIEELALSRGHAENILEFFDKDGVKKVYRNLTFIIKDDEKVKFGIVTIDISSEYKAQHEVAKLKSALDRSPISIMMTDIDGNIEYINPNYSKISGYSREELIGENPRLVKSGYTSDKVYKEMWKSISRGDIWNSDVKNIAKDGSVFWEDSTILPSFNEKNEVDGYIAFKLDITDEIAIRQQLHDQEEMMLAQSRHAAMGEMISMIAHQWRQPISVIAMDANNILADVELEMLDEQSVGKISRDIIKQTQELSRTIDDFRNFFKPDRMAEESVIRDIVDNAIGIIGKSLENNEIAVSVDVSDKIKIKTYSRELMQVLVNLIKNAKEALLEKEIVNAKIEISVEEKGKYIELSVSDNAGGIDEEIIDKIFDPYFSTKGEKNGTGLGLYMSQTIIQKHMNGELSIENKDNGANFTIKLPLNMSEETV